MGYPLDPHDNDEPYSHIVQNCPYVSATQKGSKKVGSRISRRVAASLKNAGKIDPPSELEGIALGIGSTDQEKEYSYYVLGLILNKIWNMPSLQEEFLSIVFSDTSNCLDFASIFGVLDANISDLCKHNFEVFEGILSNTNGLNARLSSYELAGIFSGGLRTFIQVLHACIHHSFKHDDELDGPVPEEVLLCSVKRCFDMYFRKLAYGPVDVVTIARGTLYKSGIKGRIQRQCPIIHAGKTQNLEKNITIYRDIVSTFLKKIISSVYRSDSNKEPLNIIKLPNVV